MKKNYDPRTETLTITLSRREALENRHFFEFLPQEEKDRESFIRKYEKADEFTRRKMLQNPDGNMLDDDTKNLLG
ncbi:MAG: hypothetical protein PHQ75_09475 [Thermoguttaceae bacterium]|nr:hypothetical protein [Thermoguttaceae bacterium]